MANALYQSKLIRSVFFVILHSHLKKIKNKKNKLLFGLGKCSFWLVSWQFFPSFFWRPQIHKLSQTPLSFHRLSRPWKAYPIFPTLSKTVRTLCVDTEEAVVGGTGQGLCGCGRCVDTEEAVVGRGGGGRGHWTGPLWVWEVCGHGRGGWGGGGHWTGPLWVWEVCGHRRGCGGGGGGTGQGLCGCGRCMDTEEVGGGGVALDRAFVGVGGVCVCVCVGGGGRHTDGGSKVTVECS